MSRAVLARIARAHVAAGILATAAASSWSAAARAGGLDLDLADPRAIGRAGASVVSGDGGAALLVNPAGLARRPERRAQVGVALHDDDATYRAPDSDATDSPTISDRSSPLAAPVAAAAASIGPVVLGFAALSVGRLARELPAPVGGQPDADVARLFPHRYGGLSLGYERRALVLGAAARVGEWLGVGLSVGAAGVELSEHRRVWAGFAGRDQLAYPTRDLDLSLRASDRFVPLAAAGALLAPPQLPLEIGAGVSWSADAWPDGTAALSRTGDAPYPQPIPGDGTTAPAELRIAMPLALRAGVRYLGDRVTVELEGDLFHHRDAGKRPIWRATGLSVRDDSGQTGALTRIPSLAVVRDHVAARGAVDVELVPGLLWLTAGYAFATAATSRRDVSPAWGDLGGHTLAFGAETSWNQITLTMGYARVIAPALQVAADQTAVDVPNPFDAGTAPAGAGRHDRAHDAVGLSVEAAWD